MSMRVIHQKVQSLAKDSLKAVDTDEVSVTLKW